MKDPILLVDAHVHVHSVADVPCLLSAAAENFDSAARQLDADSHNWQGVILLAEMAGVDWFESMLAEAGRTVAEGWRVSVASAEDVSLQFVSKSDIQLIVVAGRQVVTSEGLEVLALGTRQQIPDRQTLSATIDAAHHSGALVVLPWGAGKWLGKRGRLVASVFAKATEWSVYAGDNSGRPVFWPSPDVFELAESQGFAVLPGTDPLPLTGEERQVGRFGFWMTGQLPLAAPMATLKSMVARKLPGTVQPYGNRASLWQFARNQIALRLRKHQGMTRSGNDRHPR